MVNLSRSLATEVGKGARSGVGSLARWRTGVALTQRDEHQHYNADSDGQTFVRTLHSDSSQERFLLNLHVGSSDTNFIRNCQTNRFRMHPECRFEGFLP